MFSSLTRRAFLGAVGAASASCARKPQPGYAGYAFVANEDGRAIAAVDLNALTLVRHIRLDASPTQLIGHPTRKAVYALTPQTGTVHEISTTKLQRERWNSVCTNASAIKLSPQGDSIWVLCREPRELVELQLAGMEPARRIPLPNDVDHFDLSQKAPLALLSFGSRGEVGVADLATGKIRHVECSAAVGKVRFRLDGRQWIAAHRDSRMLAIYDTISSRVVVRLPLAVRPDNLCFKSDGGQLFVTGEGIDAVVIVFPYSTDIAETVLAGRSPGPMASSPSTTDSPEFLFVTNPTSSQVTILNIESRRMVGAAQVGAEPSHVVITPDNQYALVLNRQSGDMAVIYIMPTARRTKAPAALLTMIPVGSRPVSAVVQSV